MAGTITFTLDADTAGFVQAATRAYDRVRALDGGTQQLQRSMNEAASSIARGTAALDKTSTSAEQSASAFGAVIGRVIGLLGPASMLASAMGVLKSALSGAREEARKAADDLRGMETAMQSLAVASGGSPERLSRLQAAADRLAVRYGMGRGRAASLVSSAEISGFGESAEEFIRAEALAGLPADQLITAANIWRSASGEQVDVAEYIAQVVAAARASTIEPQEILSALPRLGLVSAAAGASLPETLSLIGAIGTRVKGRQGITLAENLLEAIARHSPGAGLLGGIESLSDVPEFQDTLARSPQLAYVYRMASGSDFASTLGEVRSSSTYRDILNVAMNNPDFAAVREAASASAVLDVMSRRRAVERLAAEAARNRLRAVREADSPDALARINYWLADRLLDVSGMTLGSGTEKFLADYGAGGYSILSRRDLPDDQRAVLEELRGIRAELANQRRSLRDVRADDGGLYAAGKR